MSDLILYNTLVRKKMPFEPLDPAEIKLYTCGPTVYNYAHIGNLRTYVFEDLLRRVLEFNGYQVNHVMNITDVGHLTSDADDGEDKMEKGKRNMLYFHCKFCGGVSPTFISCGQGEPYRTLTLKNVGVECIKCKQINILNKEANSTKNNDVFYVITSEQLTVWDISKKYTDAFMSDMEALNLLEPHIKCKATDHIQEMINQIKQLKENGLTYIANGNVYFDTSKIPDYGKLARLNEQELQAGARIEVDKGKKNPTDFVLWFTKSKFTDQTMQWESPWGRGYPGWHIECSAMSIKYLGNQIDIHCGGIDHIPVHHTNELAQAEGATNIKPWVLYWMHGNFMVLDPLMNITLSNNIHICPFCGFENLMKTKKNYIIKKEDDGNLLMVKCKKCNKTFSGAIKMAKSANNFLRLQPQGLMDKKSLVDKGYSPLDFRYFCLQAHYRKELTFSWEAMDSAKTGLRRLRERVTALSLIHPSLPIDRLTEGEINQTRFDAFESAINDDLNIPQALSITWEVMDDTEISDSDKLATIKKFDEVLGLDLDESITFEIPAKIQKLKAERDKARKEKDWKKSDELRTKIEKAGFMVKDGPNGTEVQPK